MAQAFRDYRKFVSFDGRRVGACLYVFKNGGIFVCCVFIYSDLEAAFRFADVNFATVACVFVYQIVRKKTVM